MARHGGDADDSLDEQLSLQSLLNVLGQLDQLAGVGVGRDLLDHGDVGFVDVQDKVLLLVGEHALQHIHGGHIGPAHLPDQQHSSGQIGGKMQLLGADVDITGQNVVGDDIFDKGPLVMLFFVVGLGSIQGHVGHDTDALGRFVISFHEHGIVKIGAPTDERLQSFLLHHNHRIRRAVETNHSFRPLFPDHGSFAAGYHVAIRVNDADHAVCGFFHLDNHTLKNTAGHEYALLQQVNNTFTQSLIDIIHLDCPFFKRALTVYFKFSWVFCAIFQIFRHLR